MRLTRELLAPVLLLSCADARSLETTATLDHTSEYTTNSELEGEDETEEWIHSPGFTVGASQATAKLDLDANYRYRRRIYTDSEFGNEDITTGSASATWRAIADRLDFFGSNTRSESTERAIDADNPDNRQVVSNTIVGSNLRFRPRRGDEFSLGYAYQMSVRDNTNDDSQSHTGTATYRVGLSPNRDITLLGTYSDNSYDDIEDATSTTVTIGYSDVRDDLSVDISAGYSQFDRDNRDTVEGGVYDASIEWEISGSSSLAVKASRGINDESSTFADREDFDETLSENSATNEAFTETRGSVTWNQAFGANSFSLAGFASKEEYEDVDDDNERIGVSFSMTRPLTRTTNFTADVSYENSEFDEENDEQDEVFASVRLTHRFGRRLSIEWGGSYEDRSAETTDSYDAWTFTIALSYMVL